MTEPTDAWPQPDVPEWVQVRPNTIIASVAALRGAAEIHRRLGAVGQADGCEELARRLACSLPLGVGPVPCPEGAS